MVVIMMVVIVIAPVRMVSFPIVEMMQPRFIHRNPNVAGAQIIILAADHAHVFVAIPDIIIRGSRSDSHAWRWLLHRWWRAGAWMVTPTPDPAIRFKVARLGIPIAMAIIFLVFMLSTSASDVPSANLG